MRCVMVMAITAKALVYAEAAVYAQGIAGASGAPRIAARQAPFFNSADAVRSSGPSPQVSRLPPVLAPQVPPPQRPIPARPSAATGSQPPRGGLSNYFADCDEEPSSGIIGLLGYDSWRGVSDGSWQNNGVSAGLNYGTRLGRFSDLTGVGFQIGGTVGVFDWLGTDYRLTDRNTAETQGFLTYGFFRKPNENSPFSAAIVEDWMFNDNFGVYAQNPTLSQLRWQFGYATSAANEFGIWGASRVMGDTRFVSGQGATSWRPLNQLNPYWHHKWTAGGADTTIWIGVPDDRRFSGGGSLGDYIAGALATVPLDDRVSLYTQLTYMHASARPGPIGSTEDAWNFTIALLFYPGRNARATTVAGRCWLPRLPIANNGLFMVDTNR